MKKIIATLKISTLITMLFFSAQFSNAQVGINTTSPDPSSMLDVSATDKGMLTPRMTTAQKNAITTPANGLLVYDTDYKEFSYYDAVAGWINIKQGRTNFKRIKSTDVLANVLAAELLAGGGTKYVMSANTLYEINGTVFFDFPIEMNSAYISGLDSGDDKIVRTTGNIFDGATGGTIKGLTLVAAAGKVFNISGANTENIIFRDCIVANSSNVGSIDGLGLVFFSVVQFSGNTTGIEYSNISQLLLSNLGWFSNNSGTFEKLKAGTFGLVQKQGGFTQVDGAKIGFDVSENPVISGDAVMESVVFTGVPTGAGAYVKPYTIGTYAGFNFNNKWAVTCAGLPLEGDRFTSGNLYLNRSITYPSISFGIMNIAYKLPGTTISTNLYRMTEGIAPDNNNRLVYNGQRTRTFTVTSSISMQVGGSGVTDFLFFFVKYSSAGVASIVTSSETFIDSNSGYVQSFPVSGVVQLSAGEYVELHGARLNGSNKTLTFNSYNMSIR